VTTEWRALGPGETDHELLWSLVAVATGTVALLAWSAGALGLPACVFKAVTGLPCVTCGSTRALAALAAGEVLAAIRWNPLMTFGVFGLAAYVPYGALASFAGLRRCRLQLTERESRAVRWVVLFVVAATWAFLVMDGR
jgi:hypothetical protein